MATMQFDLVSPERRLASLQVSEVQLPGADGDLTAMPDHAPMITTLRPGIVKVAGPEGEKSFFVTGGFADVSGPSTTVLAERAVPVEEVSAELMDEIMESADQKRKDAKDSDVEGAADAAAKFLSDLVAARSEIGLPTSSKVPAP